VAVPLRLAAVEAKVEACATKRPEPPDSQSTKVALSRATPRGYAPAIALLLAGRQYPCADSRLRSRSVRTGTR